MGSQVQFKKCFNAIFHNETLSPHTKDVTLEASLKRNIIADTWNACFEKNDIQERQNIRSGRRFIFNPDVAAAEANKESSRRSATWRPDMETVFE